jgi:hypothetical protein
MNVFYHLTSVFDTSIYEALSKVIQKLIPEQAILERLLDLLCQVRLRFSSIPANHSYPFCSSNVRWTKPSSSKPPPRSTSLRTQHLSTAKPTLSAPTTSTSSAILPISTSEPSFPHALFPSFQLTLFRRQSQTLLVTTRRPLPLHELPHYSLFPSRILLDLLWPGRALLRKRPRTVGSACKEQVGEATTLEGEVGNGSNDCAVERERVRYLLSSVTLPSLMQTPCSHLSLVALIRPHAQDQHAALVDYNVAEFRRAVLAVFEVGVDAPNA